MVEERPTFESSVSDGIEPPTNQTISEVRPQKWWLVEVWDENREAFKALIEHAFAFVLLIGVLVLLHYFLELISLPQEKKEILDTIDFWGIVSALVIFGISFIIKLLVLTFRGTKNDNHSS